MLLENSTLLTTTYIENATPLQQLQIIHRNSDGWITFFRKEEEKTVHYHYKLNQLNSQMLNEWVTNDSYFSMNTFFTPKRDMNNLRHLHTCYVDIDCYKFNLNVDQVLYELKENYFDIKIPKPNLINYSGRGLQLIWLIEPLSGLAIERWTELQRNLYAVLKPFGADSVCLDASRVFRLAGSVNSKSKELVICDILHTFEYKFYEVAKEYFPKMKALEYIKNKNKKSPGKKKVKRKNPVHYLFTSYSLSKARLEDLFTLVNIRKGECKYSREYFLFLSRYFSLQISNNDKEYAIQKTDELNALFNEPLSKKEWIKATESAERYADNGGILLKNDTLIQWLNITEKEQQHLNTIISPKEKKERKRLKNTAIRRQLGMKEKAMYNLARKRQMIAQIKKLHILKSIYPEASQKELAERMNVSKTTICRYLSILKSSFHELYALVKGESLIAIKKNLLEDDLYHLMNKFFKVDSYLIDFYRLLSVKLLE